MCVWCWKFEIDVTAADARSSAPQHASRVHHHHSYFFRKLLLNLNSVRGKDDTCSMLFQPDVRREFVALYAFSI